MLWLSLNDNNKFDYFRFEILVNGGITATTIDA